jgi:hypothetical protein
MRKLRSTAALIALFVTAWSNLTAFQCGVVPPTGQGDAHAEGAHGSHHAAPGTAQDGHQAHRHGATTGGDEGSPAEHAGQECAILMSCGTLARARSVTFVQAILPPPVDHAPFASIAKPSAADRTQEPPPPRRHA